VIGYEHCRFEFVDMGMIEVGDTVVIEGVPKTVGKNDIRKGGFMGDRLFGINSQFGRVLVKRVLFPRMYRGRPPFYVTQP